MTDPDAKKDSELLLNEVLPLAKNMLQSDGEFYPYGGYMGSDGRVVQVGAEIEGDDRPKAVELVEVLRNKFITMARANQCKAVALVFNVKIKSPRSEGKVDAIQVCLDHRQNYSVEVLFAYFMEDNCVRYGEVFSQKRGRPHLWILWRP